MAPPLSPVTGLAGPAPAGALPNFPVTAAAHAAGTPDLRVSQSTAVARGPRSSSHLARRSGRGARQGVVCSPGLMLGARPQALMALSRGDPSGHCGLEALGKGGKGLAAAIESKSSWAGLGRRKAGVHGVSAGGIGCRVGWGRGVEHRAAAQQNGSGPASPSSGAEAEDQEDGERGEGAGVPEEPVYSRTDDEEGDGEQGSLAAGGRDAYPFLSQFVNNAPWLVPGSPPASSAADSSLIRDPAPSTVSSANPGEQGAGSEGRDAPLLDSPFLQAQQASPLQQQQVDDADVAGLFRADSEFGGLMPGVGLADIMGLPGDGGFAAGTPGLFVPEGGRRGTLQARQVQDLVEQVLQYSNGARAEGDELALLAALVGLLEHAFDEEEGVQRALEICRAAAQWDNTSAPPSAASEEDRGASALLAAALAVAHEASRGGSDPGPGPAEEWAALRLADTVAAACWGTHSDGAPVVVEEMVEHLTARLRAAEAPDSAEGKMVSGARLALLCTLLSAGPTAAERVLSSPLGLPYLVHVATAAAPGGADNDSAGSAIPSSLQVPAGGVFPQVPAGLVRASPSEAEAAASCLAELAKGPGGVAAGGPAGSVEHWGSCVRPLAEFLLRADWGRALPGAEVKSLVRSTLAALASHPDLRAAILSTGLVVVPLIGAEAYRSFNPVLVTKQPPALHPKAKNLRNMAAAAASELETGTRTDAEPRASDDVAQDDVARPDPLAAAGFMRFASMAGAGAAMSRSVASDDDSTFGAGSLLLGLSLGRGQEGEERGGEGEGGVKDPSEVFGVDEAKAREIEGRVRQQFLARIGLLEKDRRRGARAPQERPRYAGQSAQGARGRAFAPLAPPSQLGLVDNADEAAASRDQSSKDAAEGAARAVEKRTVMAPWDGVPRLVLILGLEDLNAATRAAEAAGDLAASSPEAAAVLHRAGALPHLLRLCEECAQSLEATEQRQSAGAGKERPGEISSGSESSADYWQGDRRREAAVRGFHAAIVALTAMVASPGAKAEVQSSGVVPVLEELLSGGGPARVPLAQETEGKARALLNSVGDEAGQSADAQLYAAFQEAE